MKWREIQKLRTVPLPNALGFVVVVMHFLNLPLTVFPTCYRCREIQKLCNVPLQNALGFVLVVVMHFLNLPLTVFPT